MKKLPLYTIVLILGLFGCSSQKKLVEQAPFTIKNPTCQEFAAGRPEGGSGFTLEIPVDGLPSDIHFEKVYFRGHQMIPHNKVENGSTVLICEYQRNIPPASKDIIMHADPMEEVGNQPPALLKEKGEEFPFELKGDEAVLEYRLEGKRKSRYYKISGIKEKTPRQYPSRPQN
ncbi:hypothetical protein SAMN06265375_101603 [Muriicola jejuensis]|uniref:Lipoprotein n=1 Tax=Muriicola jejuensis TaxID=504488 RepID=A0A6P0UI66_9FLAO|nr:hypothetical protein [Muriicola jejuensis]NER09876.1 hypothetical protein [Muriicola jejuensis]SMP05075.1 hypothetical protein SAMN06265375_101603 [Muriicola jejuensis]